MEIPTSPLSKWGFFSTLWGQFLEQPWNQTSDHRGKKLIDISQTTLEIDIFCLKIGPILTDLTESSLLVVTENFWKHRCDRCESVVSTLWTIWSNTQALLKTTSWPSRPLCLQFVFLPFSEYDGHDGRSRREGWIRWGLMCLVGVNTKISLVSMSV